VAVLLTLAAAVRRREFGLRGSFASRNRLPGSRLGQPGELAAIVGTRSALPRLFAEGAGGNRNGQRAGDLQVLREGRHE
jgi:hypothetical protein